jgi:hypothetical protein
MKRLIENWSHDIMKRLKVLVDIFSYHIFIFYTFLFIEINKKKKLTEEENRTK